MPEIKNTFLQGKMNKDLDERLLPNGQYRDALNVEVSTSEDSNIGVVKNVLGNYRVEDIVDTNVFTCVGSIANEKTNKLYWFVSSYGKDAIIEYDTVNDISLPVLVDTNAGNYKAVLKFSGNIITGINIIDNLLFWTDNNSEPHKINIDECKKGTIDMDTHTQLVFENGSSSGITLDKIAVNLDDNDLLTSTAVFGEYFWVAPIPFVKAVGNTDVNGQDVTGGNFDYAYSNSTGYVFSVRHYRDNEFLGIKEVRYFGNTTEEAIDEGAADNSGTYGLLNTGSSTNDWKKGDVIFGNDITVDIEERHITVVKPKPLNALSVKINHTNSSADTSDIPNLFETKLPRFSYRYKYRDGEYSTFAPFTKTVFNPKYPKDTSASFDSNVFYNQDNAYDIKEPYNRAMINSIHSVELTDFINSQTPEDVIEIDILYKQEESSVIYSIDTIKHVDKAWHTETNTQGADVGYNNDFGGDNYSTKGGLTKGKYIVTTENIYAALPANQLLRPWDNVPKKALAQEITGNRIVYGNYVQNYDLVNNTKVSVNYNDRKNNINTFATHGLPSIKSQRNYQVGVVYSDKYGRETPVFTSKDGAVNVPWQSSNGKKNASKSNQLNVSVVNNFPEWVDSLKFFVKETSNEYYNLTMERAWVTKSTYSLDNSEGHIYISFPSSDRNKISEDDYIILKKKIGAGEEQVSFENKFKVIDIQNEAPDAIKYQLNNLGFLRNGEDYTESFTQSGGAHAVPQLGTNTNSWPSHYDVNTGRGTNRLRLAIQPWTIGQAGGGYPPLESDEGASQGDPITTKDLYISWFREESGKITSSKRYKIVGGKIGGDNYVLKLEDYICKEDADIAHILGDSSQTTSPTSGPNAGLDPATQLHPNLVIQIEKRELRDSEDFSGKFFVKISKNQVVDLVTNNEKINILDQFKVQAKTSSFYWEDKKGSDADTSSVNYGLLSFTPTGQIPTGDDSILHADNNNNGGVTLTDADGNTLQVTDYHTPWEGILAEFGPTFFVDAIHMAAGQSEASNYAKYCCVTWAGIGNEQETEESAWSYPPLKTWLGEFEDTSGVLQSLENDSVWYNNNLISTSPVLSNNPDFNDLPVDGWVGPLQKVDRRILDNAGADPVYSANNNHVNGLEGFITTTSVHATAQRRWFSGITGNTTENGVGIDTKTYSTNGEIDRHFMHISFFAPGKDLCPDAFDATPTLYGEGSWADNLQGIWGGGVFTGEQNSEVFGTETGHVHLAMEGNYSSNNLPLTEAPGPGVGFGYNTEYRELHERQWDPTFNNSGDQDNKIRNFIRNLKAGAKFRFNKANPLNDDFGTKIDDTVYTVKNVKIKKLYNHTSWRKTYNRFLTSGGYHPTSPVSLAYRSVEDVALEYLNKVDDNGVPQNAAIEEQNLKDKIAQFGAAHNRRICYIVELDKNPVDSQSNLGNPIGDVDIMSANHDNDKFCDIEFLDEVVSPLLSDLSKFPAIWEVDPKKQEVDLDIYYEASSSIPVRLNNQTNELFAPIGCKVEVLNSSVTGSSVVEYWDGEVVYLNPGFPKGDSGQEINYTGMLFKFIREDGSYTVAEAGEQSLDGVDIGVKKDFAFREEISDNITVGLSWYNCFSFGNGLESNRIRDGFNEVFISNGVKASTTTQETYKEERRAHGLIYSGLYNSNSGVNDLNQFIMAEKITKDINPTYGSIQKLFSRNTDLITFCEDKVVKILANKDAVFNADGNTQLTATENVLGQTVPFVGDYGISKNPESFASESYRAYFTDKQRGAVLRLSRDGLTPISSAGMNDWFRDNLRQYNSLIGTYDNYKQDYNLTLDNNDAFFENLVADTYFKTGDELSTLTVGQGNIIDNPSINSGTTLNYLHDTYNVTEYDDPDNPFDWAAFTIDEYDLKGSVTVTHHKAIIGPDANGGGGLQPHVPYNAGIIQPATDYAVAIYKNYDNGLADDGWIYDPRFDDPSPSDIFGPSAGNDHDANKYSTVVRVVDGVAVDESNVVVNGDLDNHPTYNNWPGSTNMANVENILAAPHVEKLRIEFPLNSASNYAGINGFTGMITRTNAAGGIGTDGAIMFDRVTGGSNSYVEFRDLGLDTANNALDGNIMDNYANQPNAVGNPKHSSMYNGDEIHIQVRMRVYPTATPFPDPGGNGIIFPGYNIIKPAIQILDGNTPVDDQDIRNVQWSASSAYEADGSLKTDPLSEHRFYHHRTYSSPNFVTPGVGFDFVSNFHPNGNDGDWEFISPNYCSKKLNTSNFATGNTVIFPDTSSITFTGAGAIHSETIVVNCSFKFQDKTGGNNAEYPYDQEIPDVKVVDDLRIRVWNDQPSSTSGAIDIPPISNTPLMNDNGDRPLLNQFWEIERVYVKKGYGIWEPHVPDFDGIANPIQEVQPVPPFAVPAWTEVTHAANYGFGNSWFIDPDGDLNNGALNGVITHQQTAGQYGSDYAAVVQTGLRAAANASDPPGTGWPAISYVVPQNWGFGTAHHPSLNNDALQDSPEIIGTIIPAGAIFDRAASIFNNNYNAFKITDTPSNEYIEITAESANDRTDIKFDLGASEEWETNLWYLVDVEFDETYGGGGNIGNGGADGKVLVFGAADNNGWNGTVIDTNGVGIHDNGSVKLVQVNRSEYGGINNTGDDKLILRGIFQVHPNSYIMDPINPLRKEHFGLRIVGCTNGVRINKIITKKLSNNPNNIWTDFLSNSGNADSWVSQSGVSNTMPAHAFQNKNLYFRNSSLNWNVPASALSFDLITNYDDNYKWEQVLLTPPSEDSTPWELSFDVSEIQEENVNSPMSGSLQGFIAIEDPNNSDVPKGLYFYDITEVGKYKLRFTFDENTVATTLDDNGNPEPTWRILRADIGQDNYAAPSNSSPQIDTISSISGGGIYPNMLNKLYFSAQDNTVDSKFKVNILSLNNGASVFTGGSAGSWNFDGFNTSIYDYIFWDVTSENLVFQNCPLFQTGSNKFINCNQQIENTVNQYETYRIRLEHTIQPGGGKLSVYYYNNDGFGFKINNINDNSYDYKGTTYTIPGTNADGYYAIDQTVTIGDSIWEPVNEEDPTFNPNLKNSFVIEVSGDPGNIVSGSVDNVMMTQVFNNFIPNYDGPKTLTFSETVNGWVSFKDFIPENGVSVSKKYFTFRDGGLYQHYVPLVHDNATGNYIKTNNLEDAENYNRFYNETYYSSIKAVLNQEPSLIKTFNTVNYEGSQAYIVQPVDNSGNLAADQITPNNAMAAHLGGDVHGWECSEIITNSDRGSIYEFIKKEGKWFNYIKGEHIDDIDTSLLNVQGIGEVLSVTDLGGGGIGGGGPMPEPDGDDGVVPLFSPPPIDNNGGGDNGGADGAGGDGAGGGGYGGGL